MKLYRSRYSDISAPGVDVSINSGRNRLMCLTSFHRAMESVAAPGIARAKGRTLPGIYRRRMYESSEPWQAWHVWKLTARN